MDCKDVKIRLLDYYYGEVAPPQLTSLEGHLDVCHTCRLEWEGIKRTLDSIEREEELTLPDGFWRDYNHKVYERIDKKRRWKGILSYPRLVPIAVSILLIVAIFGGLRIKGVREEVYHAFVVQDYAMMLNLDLLQDFELIQHLEELEGV